MATTSISWTNGSFHLVLSTGEDRPVGITYFHPSEEPSAPLASGPAVVEVLTVQSGRARTSQRYGESAVGSRLRYTGHDTGTDRHWHTLTVRQRDPETGIEADVQFRAAPGATAVQAVTTVRNAGRETVHLQAVTSLAAPLLDGGRALTPPTLRLASGRSQWLGENQWTVQPFRAVLPDLNLAFHDQDQRGHVIRASTSSWSTGGPLPTAAVVDTDDSWCWMWQVEHNGGWAWELSETRTGINLALLGPTDDQHQWLHALQPGQSFTSVPASLAVSDGGLHGALAEMTAHRRALRGQTVLAGTPVVYNDFMNTLMGDPTTDKLLPLIGSAKSAGADVFCIDAGWYDDGTDWWDAVGEWQPCTVRFPGGLGEVTDTIGLHGMSVGIWLEPEVIGVRSTMAQALPPEAFLQRNGVRVVEHGRYHLDFRHPAVRAHLDETVDRLVHDFGVSYLKLDYNITAGPGTDVDAGSTGAGLLGHNRAYLDWLDGIKARHPLVTIENCASGAMRQDYALLSRLDLQSTSDQQDLLLYPPIAANAFLSVLPEQAANWAYPQADMTTAEIQFTMATGMLGRMCLSGFLDQMTPEQLGLVRAAVMAHQALLPEIHTSSPFLPSGIPQWEDQWLSAGLATARRDLITVWNRGGPGHQLKLHLPRWEGREVLVDWVGPAGSFDFKWDASGYLFVTAATPGISAGTFAVCAAGEN